MVQGDITVIRAPVKDSTGVTSPWAGVGGNGKRSLVGHEVHNGLKAVGLQDVVAGESSNGLVGHVQAILSVHGVSGNVGIVFLTDVSKELDVGEAELGDRSHTSSGATALERVGSARSHLLGGKEGKVSSRNLNVRFNSSSGGKSPAGSTRSLILDRTASSFVAPVDGLWKILDVDVLAASEGGRVGGGGSGLVSAHHGGFELSVGHVAELVDSHLPGDIAPGVVSVHLLEVGLEHVQSELGLLGGGIALAELLGEAGELLGVVPSVVKNSFNMSFTKLRHPCSKIKKEGRL